MTLTAGMAAPQALYFVNTKNAKTAKLHQGLAPAMRVALGELR